MRITYGAAVRQRVSTGRTSSFEIRERASALDDRGRREQVERHCDERDEQRSRDELGSAIRPSEMTEIAWSTGRSRRIPDQMPSASDTGRSTIRATSASTSEFPARAEMNEVTGACEATDVPRSPRATCETHVQYCSYSGLVEPELPAVDLLLRGRRAAAEDRARGVAGQHLGRPEDEHRDEREQDDPDRQPAQGEPYERVKTAARDPTGGDRGHAGRLRLSPVLTRASDP